MKHEKFCKLWKSSKGFSAKIFSLAVCRKTGWSVCVCDPDLLASFRQKHQCLCIAGERWKSLCTNSKFIKKSTALGHNCELLWRSDFTVRKDDRLRRHRIDPFLQGRVLLSSLPPTPIPVNMGENANEECPLIPFPELAKRTYWGLKGCGTMIAPLREHHSFSSHQVHTTLKFIHCQQMANLPRAYEFGATSLPPKDPVFIWDSSRANAASICGCVVPPSNSTRNCALTEPWLQGKNDRIKYSLNVLLFSPVTFIHVGMSKWKCSGWHCLKKGKKDVINASWICSAFEHFWARDFCELVNRIR